MNRLILLTVLLSTAFSGHAQESPLRLEWMKGKQSLELRNHGNTLWHFRLDDIYGRPCIEPLALPDGSVDKMVTSSDDFPIIGDLSYVTDGDKDGGEGYYVELMNGLQWVQIDLEEEAQIEAVWIWHYHSQLRAYQDVVVQVSKDPAFESGVTTLYNNDFDNSAGLGRGNDRPYIESRLGKLIDGNGTRARYVRLYSNGNTANDMNHYTEVEVYGR